MESLPTEALAQVAACVQTLSEPNRLQVLDLLHGHEGIVGELVAPAARPTQASRP